MGIKGCQKNRVMRTQYNYFQSLKKMRWTSFFLFLSVISATFLFHGCQKRGQNDNVILMTLDTQRADFISSYSSGNASTPHIDALAQQGILYEKCYALIPITLPSHASIFFSEPPHIIKNYNNGQEIGTKRRRPSFVNIFKKNGYVTGAFISLGVLKSNFGLAEGFYHYEDTFPKGRWYLTAEEVNRKVFPWLEQNKDSKFFLWIHYSDPHEPYAPPDVPDDIRVFLNDRLLGEYCLGKYTTCEVDLPLKKGENTFRFEINNIYQENAQNIQVRFDMLKILTAEKKELQLRFGPGWKETAREEVMRSRDKSVFSVFIDSLPSAAKLIFRGRLNIPLDAVRSLYKREVEYMDGEIGRLREKLEELGLFGKTHIVMVGDHGEGLGEYMIRKSGPHVGHIHYLYDIYMRVPLIIWSPSEKSQGRREKMSVSLLDIGPTIMDLAGFRRLSHFKGRNLFDLKSGAQGLPLFEATYKPEAIRDKFAILKHPWHLILTPEEKVYELYNLSQDPQEKENVYDEKVLPSGVSEMKKSLDAFARKALAEKSEIKVDDKTKEMLRALGYIR